MKSNEHFTSQSRLSHYSVLLLFLLLSTSPASSQPKIFEVERMTLDVTKMFKSYRNWLWSSDFHKQFYLQKPFTTHFIFYLFQTLHQVAYSAYVHLFDLLSFFQQSTDKARVLLFPSKVLCCFYVLDCIVRVSKSFEHPIYSKSTFSIQIPSFLPKRIP